MFPERREMFLERRELAVHVNGNLVSGHCGPGRARALGLPPASRRLSPCATRSRRQTATGSLSAVLCIIKCALVILVGSFDFPESWIRCSLRRHLRLVLYCVRAGYVVSKKKAHTILIDLLAAGRMRLHSADPSVSLSALELVGRVRTYRGSYIGLQGGVHLRPGAGRQGAYI
jgi:hypothetical protein